MSAAGQHTLASLTTDSAVSKQWGKNMKAKQEKDSELTLKLDTNTPSTNWLVHSLITVQIYNHGLLACALLQLSRFFL